MKLELITPKPELSRRLCKRRLIQFPLLTMPLIAALTPGDVDIHHTDEIVEPVDFDREADLVVIACNTPAANHVYRLGDPFRARGRKVVLGGPHVTAAHCDAVVTGEAEGIWPKVIEDFRRGNLKPIYKGSPADLAGPPTPAGTLRGDLSAAGLS